MLINVNSHIFINCFKHIINHVCSQVGPPGRRSWLHKTSPPQTESSQGSGASQRSGPSRTQTDGQSVLIRMGRAWPQVPGERPDARDRCGESQSDVRAGSGEEDPLVSDTQEWNILTPPDSSSASNVTRFPGVVYVGQREGCKKFMIGNRVYAVSPDGTSSALKHIIPPETPATTGANPSAAPKTRFILGFTEDSFVCMDDGVLRHYPLPEAPSTHLSGSVPRKTKPRKSGGEILGAMGGGTVFIDQ